MESLQGGKFGNGFISAGLTAAVMPALRIKSDAVRTATGALVGGSISKATGGKFANGAISGAIQAAMMGPPRSRNSDSATREGAYSEERAKLAIAEGEAAMEQVRSKRYTDLDLLAKDTADALQPVTNRRDVEVGVRFFRNGDYFEAGTVVSDGQMCGYGGLRCGVNTRLSQPLSDARVVSLAGNFHTHPASRGFSTNDLGIAWRDAKSYRVDFTAYVSTADSRVYSFNTMLVGKIPGIGPGWSGYINHANRIR